MADTKISALPSGAAGVGTVDAFPIARAGSNFKLTLGNVFDLAGGYVNDGTTGTTYAFPSLSVLANGSGSTGYVGIGTKTPTASLDVLGLSGINIRSTGTAQLRIAGNSGAIGTNSLDIFQTSTSASILNRANAPLSFGTNATSRLQISADGTTVSILNPGTTNNTLLTVGESAATGETGVRIGYGRTGNGYTSIALIGDTTYTAYGARFLRSNTGANAATAIQHRGTGDFQITTEEAASVKLSTNGTTRLTVGATGGVTLDATPATSSNDTTVATTAFVKNTSIGWGQTWKLFSASAGTTYTNTTGRPYCISVKVWADGDAYGTANLQIGGVQVARVGGDSQAAAQPFFTMFGIVPPGTSWVFSMSFSSGQNSETNYLSI